MSKAAIHINAAQEVKNKISIPNIVRIDLN